MFLIDVLILSCFIGYFAIWHVTPMLHSPLMSVTNAISGIVILGSIQTLNYATTNMEYLFLYFAIFLASLNIFGGFYISGRMLNMFKKKDSSND